MTTNMIHQLIGRALTDRSFREQLLLKPQVAIKEYPLSESEQTYFSSLQAMNLEEFSRKLSERLRDSLETDRSDVSKRLGRSVR